MNIVLATDDNYVQHCAVTIQSILTNCNDVNFYIVTDGLKESNVKVLDDIVNSHHSSISYLYVDKDSVAKKLPMPANSEITHISIATYYRLFLAELVPDSVDRIIYLDCDMVVRGNLQPLFDIDLRGKALAACYLNNAFGLVKNVYERLGYSEENKYFNAGTLCLNLKYWRENNVQERLLCYAKDNYEKIVYHDQDILNAVLYKETVHVSPKYNMDLAYISEDEINNYDLSYEELKKVFINPVVVHYVSRPKPWEYGCKHPFVKEYYHYLDKTSYSGWRPKFDFSNYWQYILKIQLREIRNRLFNM